METIEFTIDGKVYTADESEGKYSIVQNSEFIGQMYKEPKGWSWEGPDRIDHHHPWEEIGRKIDKHLQNLAHQ
ncbi:hypothetical protein [Pedobacter sp. SYSU D00535]|uniref:hypothetical protein n=1 Tax=Pedobacter sp. SYSU D00535 TaxID=2810308 RepID=UPI001A96058E|nr:hypothetical protein [Pedobacter sp. SYSU D00535]